MRHQLRHQLRDDLERRIAQTKAAYQAGDGTTANGAERPDDGRREG